MILKHKKATNETRSIPKGSDQLSKNQKYFDLLKMFVALHSIDSNITEV